MEENIFKDFLEGYKNIQKELEKLAKNGKEDKNRKQELNKTKEMILKRAAKWKEEQILEQIKSEKNEVITRMYMSFFKQEQEIKQRLEEKEGKIGEEAEVNILKEKLKEVKTNKQTLLGQMTSIKTKIEKIEKDYTIFIEKVKQMDKNEKTEIKKEAKFKKEDEFKKEKQPAKEVEQGKKENRIETIEKDIEKYKKLIEKYKENEQKVEDFKREIEKLEDEKRKLLKKEEKEPIARIEDKQRKLPIRSFWEIYNSTNTEHVGSIQHKLYQLANMKLLPHKNEDTLQKVLSVPLVPIKAIIKVGSMLPNRIFKTRKKIEEMQNNIDGLSTEEFRVLVEKSEEINDAFDQEIKDYFDTDYLDPQFMKQYKVNNAYLDVVRNRLHRENGDKIKQLYESAQASYNRMKELRTIGEKRWTKEQEKEYSECVDYYLRAVDGGKRWQTQIDIFEEGAKKKSSSHRNISGWLGAKFNPDNRERNAVMANLSKMRREAYQKEDFRTVRLLTGDMQKNARRQTYIRGKGKNRIDVGMYSVESPIEILDKGQQNKGRLLLSNIAIATSVIGAYQQIRDNMANQQMVQSSNEQLKNVEVKGEANISDAPEAIKAQEAITRQSVNAGFDKAERANLDGTDWSFNGAYHKEDINVHTEAAKVAEETKQLIDQKENLTALENAVNYYNKVNQNAVGRSTNYMENHPEFDYTAFSFGSKADMDAVVDFFKNGKVPFKTNVDLVSKAAIPALEQGVDYTAVIMAMVNALYQAQKQGQRDIRKTTKVEVPQESKVETEIKRYEKEVQPEEIEK